MLGAEYLQLVVPAVADDLPRALCSGSTTDITMYRVCQTEPTLLVDEVKASLCVPAGCVFVTRDMSDLVISKLARSEQYNADDVLSSLARANPYHHLFLRPQHRIQMARRLLFISPFEPKHGKQRSMVAMGSQHAHWSTRKWLHPTSSRGSNSANSS